jgi:hypothetical protein
VLEQLKSAEGLSRHGLAAFRPPPPTLPRPPTATRRLDECVHAEPAPSSSATSSSLTSASFLPAFSSLGSTRSDRDSEARVPDVTLPRLVSPLLARPPPLLVSPHSVAPAPPARLSPTVRTRFFTPPAAPRDAATAAAPPTRPSPPAPSAAEVERAAAQRAAARAAQRAAADVLELEARAAAKRLEIEVGEAGEWFNACHTHLAAGTLLSSALTLAHAAADDPALHGLPADEEAAHAAVVDAMVAARCAELQAQLRALVPAPLPPASPGDSIVAHACAAFDSWPTETTVLPLSPTASALDAPRAPSPSPPPPSARPSDRRFSAPTA